MLSEMIDQIKQYVGKFIFFFRARKKRHVRYEPLQYPVENFDSSRVGVRYGEDGGEARDGVIEMRRGVPELALGGSRYAQVRIAVDGTHFIKGMAVYSNNLPDGVDVLVNTHKLRGTPLMDPDPDVKQVLTPMKSDKRNPFGATIKKDGGQYFYTDTNGEKKLSVINKVAEEGDWAKYNENLSKSISRTLVKTRYDGGKNV